MSIHTPSRALSPPTGSPERGFRVWGLELRVEGKGLRFEGVGLRVEGVGRVEGWWVRVVG